MKKIYINVRSIYGRDLTGVQRYGYEIYSRIPELISLDAPKYLKDGPKGQMWDQMTLPIRAKGLLWSPANLGPLLNQDQVVSIHDVSPIDHPEWFSPNFVRLNRSIQPILVQNVKHIITISNYSKSRLISNYGISPSKISVTYLAADKKFSPYDYQSQVSERQLYGWPERYILCVGSLEPRKNLRALFHAWDLWTNKPKGLKLIVVGGQGKVFSGIGFQQAPEGVELIGRVLDEHLPSLYACAEAFIYPSLYEGFGLPVLEAMASGTPVITSNSTSLPEVVGQAALTIDPGNPQEITAALRSLVGNKGLTEELIAKGIERNRIFSWDATAEETRDILYREANK